MTQRRKRPAHWPGADLCWQADRQPSYLIPAFGATLDDCPIIRKHLGELPGVTPALDGSHRWAA
jgi:hypothetical protein